jgi:S1-C subfamily serine protease
MVATIFNIVAAVFLLGLHVRMGLGTRRTSTPREAIRNAWRICRTIWLVAVPLLAVQLMLPGYSWILGLTLMFGPWVAALVAMIPLPKKVMGTPPSSLQFRSAQEGIAVVEIGPAIGNGFFVRPDLIATSFHIVAAGLGGRMRAHTNKGVVELSLVTADPFSDLVLLRCTATSVAPAGLSLAGSTDDVKAGDPVVHLSYINSNLRQPQWCEAEGTVEGKGELTHLLAARQTPFGTVMMGVSATALAVKVNAKPGQSGSPILDQQHKVIGVVSAANKDGDAALVIPVEAIQELLERSG